MPFALRDDNVSIAQRVFATATPKNTGPAGAVVMTDVGLFGNVWFSLPLKRAQAEGWILPYKLAVVMLDPAAVDPREAAQLQEHWARTAASSQLAGVDRDTTARELEKKGAALKSSAWFRTRFFGLCGADGWQQSTQPFA